jgi:hypothetical protein
MSSLLYDFNPLDFDSDLYTKPVDNATLGEDILQAQTVMLNSLKAPWTAPASEAAEGRVAEGEKKQKAAKAQEAQAAAEGEKERKGVKARKGEAVEQPRAKRSKNDKGDMGVMKALNTFSAHSLKQVFKDIGVDKGEEEEQEEEEQEEESADEVGEEPQTEQELLAKQKQAVAMAPGHLKVAVKKRWNSKIWRFRQKKKQGAVDGRVSSAQERADKLKELLVLREKSLNDAMRLILKQDIIMRRLHGATCELYNENVELYKPVEQRAVVNPKMSDALHVSIVNTCDAVNEVVNEVESFTNNVMKLPAIGSGL